MIDPGAYDIESTLETITLLCEQSGEPCDGARFRELIIKARAFLAARRTVSGQEAPTAEQVERAFLSQSTWTTIGYAVNWEDFQYLIAKLFAAPIPATELTYETMAEKLSSDGYSKQADVIRKIIQMKKGDEIDA